MRQIQGEFVNFDAWAIAYGVLQDEWLEEMIMHIYEMASKESTKEEADKEGDTLKKKKARKDDASNGVPTTSLIALNQIYYTRRNGFHQ
ncbi:hypothetical protein R1flu_005383 [Riccia fluitans]|uniref:Uncharacterized protein n=1 Tax=Riccia fluitans TaxID=41844 RepID=A0ABD1YT07_9MARC